MTNEYLMQRIAMFTDEAEIDPDDVPITKETINACLSFFRFHEGLLAQLVTLTTTPDGKIHARFADKRQKICHLYFQFS